MNLNIIEGYSDEDHEFKIKKDQNGIIFVNYIKEFIDILYIISIIICFFPRNTIIFIGSFNKHIFDIKFNTCRKGFKT